MEKEREQRLGMRVVCSCKSLMLVRSMGFSESDPVPYAVQFYTADGLKRNRPSEDTFVNKDCLFYIESKSYSFQKLRRKLNI